MFQKIPRTQSPPSKPLMIWDGNCGFCAYWIQVWERNSSGITFKTYQEVGDQFPEIPLKEFKKASRFIEPNGQIFSGPDSAYRSFFHFKRPLKFPHRWYQKSRSFRWLSDHAYNFMAKNRPAMMKITHAFWGKNPKQQKPFYLIWLALIFGICFFGISILF